MNIRILAAAIIGSAAILAAAPLGAAGLGTTEQAGAATGMAPSDILAGFDSGLFRIESVSGRAVPLWLDGEVKKILKTDKAWCFLTSLGIVASADLGVFENRSTGLPVKTYKNYAQGRKTFTTEVQDLKDLAIDPADSRLMVTCTKDAVYVSRDSGASWDSFGSPVPSISGLKAVGLAPYPGTADRAVWVSHPIKGLFVRRLSGGSSWAPASSGLANATGTNGIEEVASLLGVPSEAGSPTSFWASNSFLPRIYRWDPATRAFATVFKEGADFGCFESLSPASGGTIRYVAEGEVRRFDPTTGRSDPDNAAMAVVRTAIRARPDWQLLSVSWTEGEKAVALNELWLVSFKDRKPYRAKAENHSGLYLSTGFVVHQDTRGKYDRIMADRKLDSVVVDMKDDFGRLRFNPRDPLLRAMGRVSSPLDIEQFVDEWKAKGRYLVARIPVFKDQVVYEYSGGKYAVWDDSTKAAWKGYYDKKVMPAAGLPGGTGPGLAVLPPPAPEPTIERSENKEFWVDPYCEVVWQYNIAIANEIIARGFDEVQFDYIRFPTDGDNIDKASFRWRDPGMDKESALASFLRYARENIAAPISIDIYGANGWYRSGVRTGQDVELLAKYVDVICPMLYPSHFEQGFLAQAPAEERPYRIYRIGTLRNAYIARKRIAVRPYVQAFYMNVSYDRSFYNLDYVKREIAGVRDAVNLGMTFWNNAGRYDDVPVLEVDLDGHLVKQVPPASSKDKSILD